MIVTVSSSNCKEKISIFNNHDGDPVARNLSHISLLFANLCNFRELNKNVVVVASKASPKLYQKISQNFSPNTSTRFLVVISSVVLSSLWFADAKLDREKDPRDANPLVRIASLCLENKLSMAGRGRSSGGSPRKTHACHVPPSCLNIFLRVANKIPSLLSLWLVLKPPVCRLEASCQWFAVAGVFCFFDSRVINRAAASVSVPN